MCKIYPMSLGYQSYLLESTYGGINKKDSSVSQARNIKKTDQEARKRRVESVTSSKKIEKYSKEKSDTKSIFDIKI